MPRKVKRKKVVKQAVRPERKQKREGPLTLYPLDFDTALRGIVGSASARTTKGAKAKEGGRRPKA